METKQNWSKIETTVEEPCTRVRVEETTIHGQTFLRSECDCDGMCTYVKVGTLLILNVFLKKVDIISD